MKELEKKTEDKIEIVSQTQKKKQQVLQGHLKPKQGHKCFEYNTGTNELSYAKFEKQDVHFDQKITYRRKVIIKENCIYITALNFKNATKKINQQTITTIKPILIHGT